MKTRLPLRFGCSKNGNFAFRLRLGRSSFRQGSDLDGSARKADDVADVRASGADDGAHGAIRYVEVARFLRQTSIKVKCHPIQFRRAVCFSYDITTNNP